MGNKIKEIGTSLTPLKNLTYLDLSDNLIFNTNQNLSKIVSNVKTLWLTYNELAQVSNNTLGSLPNLVYFSLNLKAA